MNVDVSAQRDGWLVSVTGKSAKWMQPGCTAPPTMNLRQQLQAIVSPNDHSSWDKAWKQNITPWDNGNTQPPLKQILQEPPKKELIARSIQFVDNGEAVLICYLESHEM